MTLRIAALALCALLSAGPSSAQPAAATAQTVFISPCGQPFRAPVGGASPVVTWFAKIDLNADGLLDRDEFRAEAAAFFKVLDQDANGAIGSTEVTRYERVIAPEIVGVFVLGAVAGAPGLILAQTPMANSMELPSTIDRGFGGRLSPRGGARMVLEGAAPYGLLGDTEPVSGADLDVDGRILLDEFLRTSDRRFARLDTDGDGKLRPQDLPLTLEEQRGQGRSRPRS